LPEIARVDFAQPRGDAAEWTAMKPALLLVGFVGASLISSIAVAQPGADAGAPPQLPPPAASVTTPPPAPPVSVSPPPSEADRGGRGESCRARADCQSGLACLQNICRYPDEGKTCGARSDCTAPLACFDRVCTVEGERAITPTGESKASEAAKPEEAPARIERPFTLDLDQTFFTTSASVNVSGHTWDAAYHSTSTIIALRRRMPHVEVDAEVPMAFAVSSINGDNTTKVAAGNMALGVFYARDLPRVHLRVGGILTTPIAPDERDGDGALASAAATRGFDRLWLWAPQTITLAPSMRISSKEGDAFQHAGEVTIAPLFAFGHAKTEVILQLSEDLAGQIALFRAGARLEMVTSTAGASNNVQLSLLPHVGVNAPAGFADVGLLVNLTEPAGFSFDEGKYWGLRLRGGFRF
jgi:hypothetical protein